MRISFSGIAWEAAQDVLVRQLLLEHQVDAIDVVPGKYFPEPSRATAESIQAVRAQWADAGIAIIGMQSLLFGTSGFNVFGSVSTQQALLKHLAHVCRIAEGLGATRLVFGSPKNRDRAGLTDAEALDMGVQFFGQLGKIAEEHGTVICLEPNPTRYGANFMTTSAQTAQVVTAVDHPGIRMQLDTGALTINAETARDVVTQYAALIAHVHASEPDLVTLGSGTTNHDAVAAAMIPDLAHLVVAIEMLSKPGPDHEASLRAALKVAIGAYRHSAVGVTQ